MCFFHKNILHSFVCFIPNKNGLSIPSIATAILFSFIASLCFSLVAYFLTFTLHFLITFADYFTVILVVCFACLHYHFARENVPFRGVASDSIDCVCEFLTSTVFNFVFVAHFFPTLPKNSRSRSTVVYSYDLTTCPSWVQSPNKPRRHT